MNIKALFTGFPMSLLGVFLVLSTAQAYPPAPNCLIYGLAKDQYGNPLSNPTDTVVLQTTAGVQVVANIQPNLAIGVNYAMQVPMDAGSIPPPYVSNALTTGTPFILYVVTGSTTNLPIEMQGTNLTFGAPSQQLLQNLSLGQSLGNSGVPIAWAEELLASLGLHVASTNINPYGVYTPDGRTLQQEYLLGNYPYQTNAFSVSIVNVNAGSAVLAFATVAGRTYTVSGSADLNNWTPLSFTIPAVGTNALTAYSSSSVQPLQIQTIQPAPLPKMQFFRLQLQ